MGIDLQCIAGPLDTAMNLTKMPVSMYPEAGYKESSLLFSLKNYTPSAVDRSGREQGIPRELNSD
jgi:hypothetical protein